MPNAVGFISATWSFGREEAAGEDGLGGGGRMREEEVSVGNFEEDIRSEISRKRTKQKNL